MSAQVPVTEADALVPRQTLAALYEADEVAWLDESVRLIRTGRVDELDYDNLGSYLEDMAKRDRREIESRLVVLLAHLLKWYFQPDHRSKSWQVTILSQRHELESALTGTLRRHAEECLARCYKRAVAWAAVETSFDDHLFPTDCPFTLEQALTDELS